MNLSYFRFRIESISVKFIYPTELSRCLMFSSNLFRFYLEIFYFRLSVGFMLSRTLNFADGSVLKYGKTTKSQMNKYQQVRKNGKRNWTLLLTRIIRAKTKAMGNSLEDNEPI